MTLKSNVKIFMSRRQFDHTQGHILIRVFPSCFARMIPPKIQGKKYSFNANNKAEIKTNHGLLKETSKFYIDGKVCRGSTCSLLL